MSTAPTPLSDASVSISKTLVKSGKAKTGADVGAALRASKAA